MRARVDITGQRFGRLVAVSPVTPITPGNYRWTFACDCGGTAVTTVACVRNGGTKSCGCLYRETRPRVTVNSRSPEHRAWAAMKQRCYNPKSSEWGRYGARGIGVCERWRNSFSAFFGDMGQRPSPRHSLDRWPDPDGDYRPGNCQWSTAAEQQRHRRDAVYLTHSGRTMHLDEWAAELGISRGTISVRLARGKTAAEALATPRWRRAPRSAAA